LTLLYLFVDLGNPYIRQEVANFISSRDGVSANPDHIFISNGASECVRTFLCAAISGPRDGVMVPVPQYPLYSASVALYNGKLVGYYLDENSTWSLNVEYLEKSLSEARQSGINVKVLVFINPGNPTGQCMSRRSLEDLVSFCFKNRLILIADEVYQENIYLPHSKPFISARFVVHNMGEPYRTGVELVSLHSVSKGAYGECGLRGGYMELHNMDAAVLDEIYKLTSINLSPNVPGQVRQDLHYIAVV
jgi:glutamate--glyoxylate aminotransferase